jgi:DNA-binding NtrC family response regulator
MQAKLLRALEEGKVLRVGGTKMRPIDVRFVAATNRDLLGEVARGAFRRDLYFRLSAVCLAVPPLRERPAELLPLARSFLARACERLGRPALGLSAEVIPLLMARSWPGNVRELKNEMERAALVCDGPLVRTVDVASAAAPAAPSPLAREETLREEMETLEKRRILDTLDRCGGNQTLAARLLGMPRRTLVKRLGQYGARGSRE